jgi:hypothetical protein
MHFNNEAALVSIYVWATRKANNDITSITSNGGRVNCMQVWPPIGKKKFETLSLTFLTLPIPNWLRKLTTLSATSGFFVLN